MIAWCSVHGRLGRDSIHSRHKLWLWGLTTVTRWFDDDRIGGLETKFGSSRCHVTGADGPLRRATEEGTMGNLRAFDPIHFLLSRCRDPHFPCLKRSVCSEDILKPISPLKYGSLDDGGTCPHHNRSIHKCNNPKWQLKPQEWGQLRSKDVEGVEPQRIDF